MSAPRSTSETKSSAESAQALAERTAQAMYASDAASRALGMHIVSVRPGFAQLTMHVRPDMVNGHAICHGGLIFTLADSTFAFACNSYNFATVAAGCTIEFLAAAHQDDVLTATGQERAQKGRTGIYDVDVRNGAGELIAVFRGKSARITGHVVAPVDLPA